MGKFILFAIIFLSIHVAHGQKTFVTETETITIRQNSKTLTSNWSINASINPDILEIECKEGMNVVTFSDQKDSISFTLTQNQTIDFIILKNGTDLLTSISNIIVSSRSSSNIFT